MAQLFTLNLWSMKLDVLLKMIICVPLGGSEGLFAQKTLEITDDVLATYKNQGTSRTRLL